MATFTEAMKAAKQGKRVRRQGQMWLKSDGYVLRLCESDYPASLNVDDCNDDWEIELPRECDFIEAVQLMKEGKKVKSLSSEIIYRGNVFAILSEMWQPVGIEEVEGKWIEVV